MKTPNLDSKEITKTWISGSNSCALVIPKKFAKNHGIAGSSHVIIEDTPQGILIKKLELK